MTMHFHLARNAQSYALSQNPKEKIGALIRDIYSALSKDPAESCSGALREQAAKVQPVDGRELRRIDELL